MQPLSGKVCVECQKLRVFCDFCDFFWSGAPLSGNPAVECQKPRVFCDFFWSGAPLSGKTRVECQKLVVFCVFGVPNCPENCAHDSFCLIRPFFREMKNERKSPKNVKNWRFLAIFSCLKQPSAGIRLSSVKNWRFFAIFFGRVHPSQGKRGSSVKNWVFFFLLAGQLVHVTWSCSFIIG